MLKQRLQQKLLQKLTPQQIQVIKLLEILGLKISNNDYIKDLKRGNLDIDSKQLFLDDFYTKFHRQIKWEWVSCYVIFLKSWKVIFFIRDSELLWRKDFEIIQKEIYDFLNLRYNNVTILFETQIFEKLPEYEKEEVCRIFREVDKLNRKMANLVKGNSKKLIEIFK